MADQQQAQGKRYETWQDYEMAIGCTQTVYPSSIGRQRMTGRWAPGQQWNGRDARLSYMARYGYYNMGVPGDQQLGQESNLYSAGNYAGEVAAGAETSPEVLAAARTLTNNPQLTLSAQDVQDMRVVADPERPDSGGHRAPLFVTRILPLISREKSGGEVVQSGDGKVASGESTTGAAAGSIPGAAEILAAVVRVEIAASRLEKLASALPSAPTSGTSSTPPDPSIANALTVLDQAVKASGTGGGAPLRTLRDAVSRATSILRAG